MVRFLRTIRDFWCDLMHDQPTWPIRGKYYCGKCWRIYTVPWANAPRCKVVILPVPGKRNMGGCTSEAKHGARLVAQDVAGVGSRFMPAS
jgi:hypothetical protein